MPVMKVIPSRSIPIILGVFIALFVFIIPTSAQTPSPDTEDAAPPVTEVTEETAVTEVAEDSDTTMWIVLGFVAFGLISGIVTIYTNNKGLPVEELRSYALDEKNRADAERLYNSIPREVVSDFLLALLSRGVSLSKAVDESLNAGLLKEVGEVIQRDLKDTPVDEVTELIGKFGETVLLLLQEIEEGDLHYLKDPETLKAALVVAIEEKREQESGAVTEEPV